MGEERGERREGIPANFIIPFFVSTVIIVQLSQTTYNVTEAGPDFDICVEIISGTVERDVVVDLAIDDLSTSKLTPSSHLYSSP